MTQICWVGQDHPSVGIYGVHMVFFARKFWCIYILANLTVLLPIRECSRPPSKASAPTPHTCQVCSRLSCSKSKYLHPPNKHTHAHTQHTHAHTHNITHTHNNTQYNRHPYTHTHAPCRHNGHLQHASLPRPCGGPAPRF